MKNTTLNFGLFFAFSLLLMTSCTKQEMLTPTTIDAFTETTEQTNETFVAYQNPMEDPNSVVVYDPNKTYPVEFQKVIDALKPLNRAFTNEEYSEKKISNNIGTTNKIGSKNPCNGLIDVNTQLIPLSESTAIEFELRTEMHHDSKYINRSEVYDFVLGQLIYEQEQVTDTYHHKANVIGHDSEADGNGYIVLNAQYYCQAKNDWITASSTWFWY